MTDAATWPTPVGEDGSTVPVKDLLASGDLFLTRQVGYLLVVAKRMQALEHEIDSFQAPVGSVTLPLLTMFEGKWPTLVFTWSEPWDEATATETIESWVEAVHAAGVHQEATIVVVSNTPCESASKLESVQFITMNVTGLPGDDVATEAPRPEPGTPAEAQRLAEEFVQLIHRQTGAELGYLAETLDTVDAAIDNVRDAGIGEEDASGLIYAAGCYVGEVLVRHGGGAWCGASELESPGGSEWPIAIRLPSGDGADPIGEAFRRFREGGGSPLASFYRALVEVHPGNR